MRACQCAGSCAFAMLGFGRTVRNYQGDNVPKMCSVPSCKHYRTSATMIEEKHDCADIEHVCCRDVYPNVKCKCEPFDHIILCQIRSSLERKSKKSIRDLSEKALTMLLHFIHEWNSASSTHLWPHALTHVALVKNNYQTTQREPHQ